MSIWGGSWALPPVLPKLEGVSTNATLIDDALVRGELPRAARSAVAFCRAYRLDQDL